MARVTVEVWSDVACPWCWIGKRHLETAIEQFDGTVAVAFRAFELDPSAPAHAAGDENIVEHLATKYRTTAARAQAMLDRMTQAGAHIGIDFAFTKVQRLRTVDAHRLLQLASTVGLQSQLKERLFKAYFTEGEVLSAPATLVALATDVGIDGHRAREVVLSDAYAEDVRKDVGLAQHLGIHGVPFFVFAHRYAVEGAQPPEVLLRALQQAAQDPQAGSETGTTTPGDRCDEGSCTIPS